MTTHCTCHNCLKKRRTKRLLTALVLVWGIVAMLYVQQKRVTAEKAQILKYVASIPHVDVNKVKAATK